MSSSGARGGESYETLQSRARELEKKVCVMTQWNYKKMEKFPLIIIIFPHDSSTLYKNSILEYNIIVKY